MEIREGSLEDLAMNDARTPVCRFCGAALSHTLIDLGLSALANSYVAEGDLGQFDLPVTSRSYDVRARDDITSLASRRRISRY